MRGVDVTRRVGLARAISKMGYCSRSGAAALIRAGRVRLNGAVRKDPETPVDLERDRIEIDGKTARATRKIYWMMNKPRGIVTTASDERGRGIVYDFLPQELPWVAPVGRLDRASEGLLLLTNDSEWAARITAPETHLRKVYHVQVDRILSEAELQRMIHGVRVADGGILAVKSAKILRTGEKNCWIEVALEEGKNRQIRRMLEALGMATLRLVRVAIGPVELGELTKGASRALTTEEKRNLGEAMRPRLQAE